MSASVRISSVLASPGNQERVAAREDSDQQLLNDIFLADDDLVQFFDDCVVGVTQLLHCLQVFCFAAGLAGHDQVPVICVIVLRIPNAQRHAIPAHAPYSFLSDAAKA
jgi:hypothetical protein